MKLAIVINGAGGVGKDTLCDFVKKKYKVMNVSSVDLVKKAAEILDWDGGKRDRDRKFLSDLKKLSKEYNDAPTKYLINQYENFLNSDNDVLFMHIREGDEIAHLKSLIHGNIVTILVRRDCGRKEYGNNSDDQVELFKYDYVYDNKYPLELAETDFISFIEKIDADCKNEY